MKKIVVIGSIVACVIMTLFPPQIIDLVYINDASGRPVIVQSTLEYRFIGDYKTEDLSYFVAQSRIAFDRLSLQYLIVAAIGYAIYFAFRKEEKNTD